MIPSPFEYQRAASVQEAIRLLGLAGGEGETKLLAGGGSLVPALKLRLNAPGRLIDIGRLAELKFIREAAGQVLIGAATTHYEIESSPLLKRQAPALAQAAAQIGDPQIRNMGTLGGSLAHADPAADYPAALLALEASVVVRGAAGERVLAARDFFVDLFQTALQPGELIVEVRLPARQPGTGSAYLKFPHPASRFAVVGCAALVRVAGGKVGEVRVAFTGLANAAFRDGKVEDALKGKVAGAAAVAAAAQLAGEGRELNSDLYASEEYRRHLAKVFAERAVNAALAGV